MWDRLRRIFESDAAKGDDAAPDVEQAWRGALELWGEYVELSPPQPFDDSRGDDHWPGDDPLAFIDLQSRQVIVNYELLYVLGAAESLEAVLAHEVGHHVAFPRTLGELATLKLMEQRLLPRFGNSLVNLFLDLQVNEVVGRTHAEELSAVYRGFRDHRDQPPNPIFAFYLAIYEELWALRSGALVGDEAASWMDETYASWRADARMFTQTFYHLADTYLQFAYFCAVFLRYIRNPRTEEVVSVPKIPLGDDAPVASPGDYARAMRGVERGRAAQALDEAVEREWMDEEVIDETMDGFELVDGALRAGGGQGRGAAEFRRQVAERHYAHLVERHLIELPQTETSSEESLIPETLATWEVGDDPRSIDWVASTMERGPMAAVMPRKRVYVADDDHNSESGPASLEIYLDTSGSMPAPSRQFNAMTLAAQILSTTAIRSEGRVRAVIYSDGDPMVSEWMYDEVTARRFLMHYAGGGTHFPFDVLQRRADEEPGSIRVVISDSGFIMDLRRDDGPETLIEAARRSEAAVVVLANVTTDGDSLERPARDALSHPDIELVTVGDLSELGRTARQLSDALFRGQR